jgi:hypothetical protein
LSVALALGAAPRDFASAAAFAAGAGVGVPRAADAAGAVGFVVTDLGAGATGASVAFFITVARLRWITQVPTAPSTTTMTNTIPNAVLDDEPPRFGPGLGALIFGSDG